MRRIQKILAGVFFGGVLLCGIGAGVAFVEFSSFEYGGEKLIGSDVLVTEAFDFAFEPGKGKIITGKSRWGSVKSSRITENTFVPEGTIRYVVTYNKEMARPYLAYEEYQETAKEAEEHEVRESAGQEPEVESEPESVPEQESGQPSSSEPEMGPEPESVPEQKPGQPSGPEPDDNGSDVIQGYLNLYVDGVGSEMRVILGMKDMILEELKQRRISHYDIIYVESVEIQVNPQTLPYILDEDQYYGRRIILN